MDIARKVVVVTGGGSGLGAVLVGAFRALDAQVLAVDLEPGADVLVADVTTDEGRAAVVDAAAAVGGVDVLVHNAGGWSRGGAQYPDAAPAAWRAAVELDLLAPMALTQVCLSQLRHGGGAVVDIAAQVVRLAGDDALAGRVVTMLDGATAPVLLP